LTSGEINARARGYLIRNDLQSANFRNLFTLQYNSTQKQQKTAQRLWPLSIDDIDKPTSNMTMEEIYERNRKILANEIS